MDISVMLYIVTRDGGGIRGLGGCLTTEVGAQFCIDDGDEPKP